MVEGCHIDLGLRFIESRPAVRTAIKGGEAVRRPEAGKRSGDALTLNEPSKGSQNRMKQPEGGFKKERNRTGRDYRQLVWCVRERVV